MNTVTISMFCSYRLSKSYDYLLVILPSDFSYSNTALCEGQRIPCELNPAPSLISCLICYSLKSDFRKRGRERGKQEKEEEEQEDDEKEEEEEERERCEIETLIGCILHTYWGSSPHHGCVPWPEIELVTFWCLGGCLANWSTPARLFAGSFSSFCCSPKSPFNEGS